MPVPRSLSLRAALALSILCLALGANAHVEMTNPPPRNSKYVKGATNIDYDNLSPLGPTRPFPCQGKSKGPIVATYQAGSSISVQLGGSATHDGGHCQFALSYDNGNTFVVLSTVKRECLRALGNSYTVPIPAGAPSGDAIFSWNWINAVGNREYYQDCADVTIQGTAGGSLSGPQLLVVNIAPSSVIVPEFGGARTAGENLLDARPQITVRAGQQGPGIFTGAGVAAGGTTPAPAPAPAPAAPAPAPPTAPSPSPAAVPPPAANTNTIKARSTRSAGSQPTNPTVPAPPPATPTGGVAVGQGASCTLNSLQCLPNISQQAFRMCTTNGWVNNACPGGTACTTLSKVVGNEITCGYLPPTPAPAPSGSAPKAQGAVVPVSSPAAPPSPPPAAATGNVPTTQNPVGGQVLAAGAGCTPGAMECLVGSQFRQCDAGGNWVVFQCAAPLVCRQYSYEIACDWASRVRRR